MVTPRYTFSRVIYPWGGLLFRRPKHTPQVLTRTYADVVIVYNNIGGENIRSEIIFVYIYIQYGGGGTLMHRAAR